MTPFRLNRCKPLLLLAALTPVQIAHQPLPRLEAATRPAPLRAELARQYIAFAERSVIRTQADLPRITAVAEKMARRYMNGGEISMLGQGVPPELSGRSGGLMYYNWDAKRGAQQRANDMAIVGWERAPEAGDLDQLRKLREAGRYIVGFGPRELPSLSQHVPLCDVWFDTGLGADDRVVRLSGGERAGRGNLLVNMLNSWTLTGEFAAALTRHGLMPVFWKSFTWPDGRAWAENYGKMKYHTDLKIAPVKPGKLGRSFLREIRANINRFEENQIGHVATAVSLIDAELAKGGKVTVAFMGHAPGSYVGKYEDGAWESNYDISWGKEAWTKFAAETPDNALIVRLGYSGVDPEEWAAYQQKHTRVIQITTQNPQPGWAVREGWASLIDMEYAYGDAAVSIPGYPIRILPPSGIMQIVAYESLNVEVLGKRAASR